MYRTGLGHGDAMHVGDLDPSRPGLEAWVVHEDTGTAYAHELHDARTGAIIWGENHNKDNGRGLAADIDATSPGHEMWSASFGGIYNTKGTQIGTSVPPYSRTCTHAVVQSSTPAGFAGATMVRRRISEP